MKTILRTTLFIILFSTNLKAQNIDATLLEINFYGDSNPKNITKGNTNIYFSADDDIHGRELWVHNPTTNSTTMVKDIFVNDQSGLENSYFVTINNQLYFTANDGVNGNELWTSDGTETGTFLIKNINNSGDSSIGQFKVFNGKVIFSANDNINGQELWITDGTTNGTILLKDINIGNNSSYPSDFFIFNNNMYFLSDNGINGKEIWKSDGTNSGTILLKDINPGNNGSFNYDNNFIVFNNSFYFFANNGSNGFELWKSDGTPVGTQLLKDIYPGTNSSSYKIIGSATNNYFVFGATNTTNGNELWKSDGTSSGTVLLKDINSTYSGINYKSEFVTFNNKVYFTADNNLNGNELWVTNGTPLGSQIVKDINVGINSSNISKLTSTNNFIIFSATDSSTSYNILWKSDGTSNGTSEIKNIDLSQSSNTELNFVELNNIIYFQGGYNSVNGIELWKTDGTTNNTFVVSDIYHKYGNSHGNEDFIAFNNKLIFAGTDGVHGTEPFITDGTIGGTKMIKDINPNYSSIYNDYDYRPLFTKAGNNVFFRATNGTNGYEIFKTDGTELGTSMVKDIAQGSSNSISDYTLFMEYNGIFYFRANNLTGEVLWRTDGTEAGTYILKNIYPFGSNLYENHNYIINTKYHSVFNGFLYFTANDGTGFSIWKTDGTAAGTLKVITILSNNGSIAVPSIINANSNKLFFTTSSDNSSIANNLWCTDGTQAGTTLLYSTLISDNLNLNKNIIFNNELYFPMYTNNGIALFKSDGTVNGTIEITYPGFTQYNFFNYLKSCGNYVYFSTGQNGGTVGKQLWKTDGTLTGTTLIEDIPFDEPKQFADCTCIQNNLFFMKEIYSDKIWYFDNNLQTTNFFQINILNSNNFTNYYGVSDITNLNDNLLFDGVSQESGQELYYSNIQNLLNTEDYTNENTRFDKIKVYPNPSNGNINLFISDNSKLTDINIYNTIGENLLNLKTENLTSIDLSRLNSGIYFIKISTENYSETKKIVIK
jgi:ELWxxDGT repeat protein